jgi:hypothetical protein
MSWVEDVHGKLYSDKVGYYKSPDQDVESDFEDDVDFEYSTRRSRAFQQQRHNRKRSLQHAQRKYEKDQRQLMSMYAPDEQEYIDMRNRRRQQQQHRDRITGFQRIPQMGIDMSRMGMDVTQLNDKRKKSAPKQYGYGGTSYESEYGQEEASPPQQLTEEEKKYVFDSFIDLKNTNTAVQLLTVLAVGTMSLVGLKILADMVVELSKD